MSEREAHSSTNDPTHEVLSKFHWVYMETDGVYFRVGRYDADKGKLQLDDVDCGSGDDWVFDGTRWVCMNLTEVDGTPVTETEFTGANRCRECGCMHTVDDPEDTYCC